MPSRLRLRSNSSHGSSYGAPVGGLRVIALDRDNLVENSLIVRKPRCDEGIDLFLHADVIAAIAQAVRAAPQHAPDIIPAPKPMQDHHLVPERPFRIDDGDVGHAEVEADGLGVGIGSERAQTVGIEG